MADRFWERVNRPSPDACWQWLAGTEGPTRAYGVWHTNGVKYRAHRFAWMLTRGPVPDGLELDHLCRNRRCVNPAHLEPVSHAENVRRGDVAWRRSRTHCPAGHPFDEANTYVYGRGRICRTCRREMQRMRRATANPTGS